MSNPVATKGEHGLYERGGKRGSPSHRFVMGFIHPASKRWTMKTLKAGTLPEARRERVRELAAMIEGRTPVKDPATFEEVFAAWQDVRGPGSRTRSHESDLLRWHLSALKSRRVQQITTEELTRVMRGMEAKGLSDWTRVAVLRIATGVLAYAVGEGLIVASPAKRLPKSVRPSQKERAREVRCLDSVAMGKLVAAGSAQRWQTALALAGWGGLRLGELRGLKWSDVDLKTGTLVVRRSLLPTGEEKATKTKAGKRTVTLLPALGSELTVWAALSPWARPVDYVVCGAEGKAAQQSSLRRALRSAIKRAEIEVAREDERLSWHSLRHSAGSIWVNEMGVPIKTVATMLGHKNASFTLDCYIGEGRDEATVRADFLARAEAVGVGA